MRALLAFIFGALSAGIIGAHADELDGWCAQAKKAPSIVICSDAELRQQAIARNKLFETARAKLSLQAYKALTDEQSRWIKAYTARSRDLDRRSAATIPDPANRHRLLPARVACPDRLPRGEPFRAEPGGIAAIGKPIRRFRRQRQPARRLAPAGRPSRSHFAGRGQSLRCLDEVSRRCGRLADQAIRDGTNGSGCRPLQLLKL
jgi:hypothetical protein